MPFHIAHVKLTDVVLLVPISLPCVQCLSLTPCYSVSPGHRLTPLTVFTPAKFKVKEMKILTSY